MTAKDVLAKRFRSRFNVDDALEVLQTHASDLVAGEFKRVKTTIVPQ